MVQLLPDTIEEAFKFTLAAKTSSHGICLQTSISIFWQLDLNLGSIFKLNILKFLTSFTTSELVYRASE